MTYSRNLFPSLLLSLALVLFACQEIEPDTDARDNAAAQNEELAMQYIEAYNTQDLQTLSAVLADPMSVNGVEEDRDEFLTLVEGYWGSFPDITLDPTHIVSADDYVTIRIEFSATGEGEFAGHDIDGREVRSTEIILFGVNDGQLAEYWYNWDELGFWEQLGVLESPFPEQ